MIGGVIFLVLAVIFFVLARVNARKLQLLNAVETYDAATLTAIHHRITTALGAQGLAQPCEVEGTIECDTPLIGPISGRNLVAFTHTTTREFEERVTVTSNGRSETRVERRSEQAQQNEQRVPFFVRDQTGRVQVLPAGATIELVETGQRFVETPEPWRGATRALGQRQVERGLEGGTRVFVLGTAIDHGGAVAVAHHPSDSKQAFLISRKSEQELAQSAATWARNMQYAAIGSGLVGLLLVGWSMFGGG